MNTRPHPAQRPPSHEMLLLDQAQRLARHRAGRRVVHIQLSRLRPEHRRDQHLRIARNVLQTLFAGYDGQFFQLRNADMIFITRTASHEETDSDDRVNREPASRRANSDTFPPMPARLGPGAGSSA